MKMPSAKITRSPARLIMRPQNGAVTRRIRAKTETTAPTAKLSTPKLRAKTGSTGISTPKPTATQNAISPSTMTSRGIRVERLRRSQLGAGLVAFTAISLPARRPVLRTRKAGGVGTVVAGRRQIQEEAVSVFSDIRAWLAARRGVRSQVPLLFTAQQGSSAIAGPDLVEPAAADREPGTSEAAQAVRESTSPDPGEGRAGAVEGRIDWDPVEPGSAKPTLDGTDKAGGQSQPPLPEPVMHHDVPATTQSDSIVPRGLQVAAAWSWRLS